MTKRQWGIVIAIWWVIALFFISTHCHAQTIKHIIYVSMENRSTDQLFGTLPGVQQYAVGGHSAKLCTNDQTKSCTTVGTHDVCGVAWCEPALCAAGSGSGINGGPGATGGDTCPQITTYQTGDNSALTALSSSTTYSDTPHAQGDFLNQLASGAMNGWNRAVTPLDLSYYDSTQLPYTYQLATTYGSEDNHFSSLGGPSQPAHLMMFAATSNNSTDNPALTKAGSGSPGNTGTWNSSWTCGALHTGASAPYLYTGTLGSTDPLDGTKYYGGTCTNDRTKACTCRCATGTKCGSSAFTGSNSCNDTTNCSAVGNKCDANFSIGGTTGAPCPTVTTLASEADANSVTWKYYSYNSNWNACLQSQNCYFNASPSYLSSHIYHDTQFDTDIANGNCSSSTFPQIAWLSPDATNTSMHPPGAINVGEAWIKSRMAAFFNSQLYSCSIVFITWDDWGGPYDHVPPPQTDGLPSLGFRVPLLCIGPYCKHQITHSQMEFASVLKCMEAVFSLPNMNSRDAGALDACAGSGTLSSNTDGMINTSQSQIPPLTSTSPTTIQNVTLSGGTLSFVQQQPRHSWLPSWSRTWWFRLGASIAAGKAADDMVDKHIGAANARYVAVGAGVLTYFLEHKW